MTSSYPPPPFDFALANTLYSAFLGVELQCLAAWNTFLWLVEVSLSSGPVYIFYAMLCHASSTAVLSYTSLKPLTTILFQLQQK